MQTSRCALQRCLPLSRPQRTPSMLMSRNARRNPGSERLCSPVSLEQVHAMVCAPYSDTVLLHTRCACAPSLHDAPESGNSPKSRANWNKASSRSYTHPSLASLNRADGHHASPVCLGAFIAGVTALYTTGGSPRQGARSRSVWNIEARLGVSRQPQDAPSYSSGRLEQARSV